jgi:OFA family oxalate/formate antiporter-like MFS transporter
MKRSVNRNLILASGVLVLLCMGLIYAWSIFVGPLEAEFGWTRSQTSLTFSISMLGFSLGGLSAGYLQRLTSPRFVVGLGSVLILAGFLACSQMQALWQLFVFYGVLGGVGVGLCYNTWLGSTLANFGDRTGFASGWLLMGFGLGGLILGNVASGLMYSDIGWRMTFILIGAAVFLVGVVTLPLLRLPQASGEAAAETANASDISPSQMLRTGTFWPYLFWCWILLGLGLAVVGQAAPFATDVGASPSFAATAVGLLSLGNGGARVVLGAVFDKWGRRMAAFISTLLTAAGVALLAVSYYLSILPLVIVALFLCGFGYGAISAVNPASTRIIFGGTYFQQNFGTIFVLSSPAIFIGNSISSAIKTATGSYMPFLLGAVVAAVLGFVLQWLVEVTMKKTKKENVL